VSARSLPAVPSDMRTSVRVMERENLGTDKHAARGALDRSLLAALVAHDLTVRQIAERVDRSPTTVRHWLKMHGLATSRRARRRVDPNAPARMPGVCPRHGDVEFVREASGRSHRCVVCRVEHVSAARRRRKRLLVEEAGGACVLCGYSRCVAALHFHHLDPADKRFGFGNRGLARSVTAMRQEAEKCVLLCSNCHAEVEHGVTFLHHTTIRGGRQARRRTVNAYHVGSNPTPGAEHPGAVTAHEVTEQ